ncbi:MAG: DUF4388 domain-containing protein [Pseudomonadota bacterium]
MSLSGSFSTMPFPELLQWLGDSKRTGMLTVSLEFEERYMRIAGGEIVGLSSDDPRWSDLSRIVSSRGLVEEGRLKAAMDARDRSGRMLSQVLVEDGHVATAELAKVIRLHAVDTALQLFLWHDGRFLFCDTEAGGILSEATPCEKELLIDPALPAQELLMDGMRRVDEWRRIAQLLPSDYTVVSAESAAPDLPTLEILVAAGRPLALGDLCMRIPRPRLEIIEELFEAHRRGLLEVDAALQSESSDGETSLVVQLIATARTLLEEKQFDEVAALLRSVVDLDPFNSEARELLRQARAEQLVQLYQEFAPYRIPVASFTPERLRTVALHPRERYLLSRIDGHRDIGTLAMITPLGELEMLRVLKRLRHAGLVSVR